MGIWELLLIALGLSMDAAAVAMSNGMCYHSVGVKEAGRVAGAFGIFQGIMPMIGYFACSFFEREITSLDHWVALILLGFIGGRMVWESRGGQKGDRDCMALTGKLLLMQAVATSIDAMAVGISFVSVFVGRKFGGFLRSKAELAGGLILVGIGIKIFVEHIAGR